MASREGKPSRRSRTAGRTSDCTIAPRCARSCSSARASLDRDATRSTLPAWIRERSCRSSAIVHMSPAAGAARAASLESSASPSPWREGSITVMEPTAAPSTRIDTDVLAPAAETSPARTSSWHGTLHDLSGFLGFICLTLATFFLRGVFARDPQWRRFAPHTLLYGTSLVACFAL